MDVPIIGPIVDWLIRAFGVVLIGFMVFRVMMAYGQDDDMRIWKAIFWGFIAFGLIVMGKDVVSIFQSIWSEVLRG
jgi:hypothetical protein